MSKVYSRIESIHGSVITVRAKGVKLNELADEGLVIRDSIFADEDSDNVSFTYSCGVLGGVMLREWDPMMN